MDKQLKDPRTNRVLGTIRESGGRKIFVDQKNNIRGSYDPKTNQTKDNRTNRVVGLGDQLSRFIEDDD